MDNVRLGFKKKVFWFLQCRGLGVVEFCVICNTCYPKPVGSGHTVETITVERTEKRKNRRLVNAERYSHY